MLRCLLFGHEWEDGFIGRSLSWHACKRCGKERLTDRPDEPEPATEHPATHYNLGPLYEGGPMWIANTDRWPTSHEHLLHGGFFFVWQAEWPRAKLVKFEPYEQAFTDNGSLVRCTHWHEVEDPKIPSDFWDRVAAAQAAGEPIPRS